MLTDVGLLNPDLWWDISAWSVLSSRRLYGSKTDDFDDEDGGVFLDLFSLVDAVESELFLADFSAATVGLFTVETDDDDEVADGVDVVAGSGSAPI